MASWSRPEIAPAPLDPGYSALTNRTPRHPLAVIAKHFLIDSALAVFLSNLCYDSLEILSAWWLANHRTFPYKSPLLLVDAKSNIIEYRRQALLCLAIALLIYKQPKNTLEFSSNDRLDKCVRLYEWPSITMGSMLTALTQERSIVWWNRVLLFTCCTFNLKRPCLKHVCSLCFQTS